MAQKSPVLDGEEADAFIIGWASTDRGAMRIARRWARDHEMDQEPIGTHQCKVSLDYDPDVMDPLETERANGKIGYVVDWSNA